MFTGLVERIGRIVQFHGKRMWVRVPWARVRLGESISVDGVCLTVAARRSRTLGFDLGPETRRLTTFSKRRLGEPVNLERSLRVGQRVGGHWVSGHVEARARLTRFERVGRDAWLTFVLPERLMRHVALKGSIAVDGISLTVAQKRKNCVGVMVVPYTFSHTTLGQKRVGEEVHIETDLLMKGTL